ncbi:PREDICTED: ribonuclease P protein subunit p40-like [Dinoponera quadriceps]|uniref:Ribonuclease P protein subunit p40-like n=1 Tax=Dinoponera quadriceps TaxID=609295 RepID=A0A6P3WNC2_DINQU|nr:PREDICTED: ribonuclease P protein subunit p40-like [Dinoponera quadriceps]
MLSPETWNFKPPRHHFSVVRRDYRKTDVPTTVKNHYFNHSVSVVLPNILAVPDSLLNSLSEDTDYYRVNALRACDLVNREFIEAFVKKGQVTLLTIGNKIDSENSICVTPTGYLVISLITEDYQAFGLEGKASVFDHEPHIRYVVTINLKEECFIPTKKNYKRVRVALEERLKQNFDVIVAWDPPGTNLCPSSVAAWFSAHGYDVRLCRQTFSRRAEYSLTVPTILEEGCDIDKFFEWLGVFSIAGDLSGETDDYINTYKCPSPSVNIGQVQYLQWTGFFTQKQVQEMYDTLKKYVLSQGTLPWVSLHVQGFADSPVSWSLQEHTFFVDGDNSYTIILQHNGESIIRRSLCSNNGPRR